LQETGSKEKSLEAAQKQKERAPWQIEKKGAPKRQKQGRTLVLPLFFAKGRNFLFFYLAHLITQN